MFEFKLPSLGADMDEGKLLQWLVKPGDRVHKGQVLAIVDTAKAAVDVEIWQAGVVRELLVAPETTIPVGTVLATLDELGETAAAVPSVGAMPPAGRLRISPAARRRAEALGIDPATVPGSGEGGAITLADVERAAGRPQSVTPPPAPVPRPPVAASPDRNAEMRRAIAAAMSRSKREIPHYYLFETIPLARAQAWLTAANAGRPISERLLLAALQLKAVALALAKYPELNGFFVDGRYQPSTAVHLGVAISLRQGGLIAPALRDADSKPLAQLMRELADLVGRARAGSLRSSELNEATVTVTNLGEQGVEAVAGVIYPPQVALVGFGAVAERPWVEDGTLGVAPTVVASLAADHRVSDGHRGALFLAELRARLQHPDEL
ncbi:dihydrolipoamide acetyltransferase family protein [Azospira restricta]|uniref:Dihydrolipoamide acetyltransferase component of pyruvate dehydrogenase complex n=1 Tax=Azospira restricta TaxID=404405 RepID=A0A974Y442_9RHOO|nr:dihydrolipoamide acetyltransferase family protein [Azospira restricta]QRJ64176.1 2-oxo acid dehydrogenase subunit E2 [Azospira restricta]